MRGMDLDWFNYYAFETNQKEILNYLQVSWNMDYSPNVSKMLCDFKVDSLGVLEFFDVLVSLRNACQLSYRKEWNCVRILEYDSCLPNTDAVEMKEDLFEFYDLEPLVVEDE